MIYFNYKTTTQTLAGAAHAAKYLNPAHLLILQIQIQIKQNATLKGSGVFEYQVPVQQSVIDKQ